MASLSNHPSVFGDSPLSLSLDKLRMSGAGDFHLPGWYILIVVLVGALAGVVMAMIAGIIFLAGLLLVIFYIAGDRRRLFWRDPRRRDSRGSHLPIRFFWW